MNMEAHRRAISESLDILKECIQKGIENRQRTIGFHCSVASADMLELYLHSKNLIDPGSFIKHGFFSSERKARERLDMDFPNNDKIIALLVGLENKRNSLCYGKPQPKETIEDYIMVFNQIRKIFEEMGVEYE